MTSGVSGWAAMASPGLWLLEEVSPVVVSPVVVESLVVPVVPVVVDSWAGVSEVPVVPVVVVSAPVVVSCFVVSAVEEVVPVVVSLEESQGVSVLVSDWS